MTQAQTAPTLASLHDQLATFALWIDGVGGYLLSLSHRVTIGKAMPDTKADLSLIADISRHHATIQRDPEGYFLEAVRKVQVNGKPIGKTLLRNEDRVTLGNSCQVQFFQPVPVSTSARLNIVSGHRFSQPVEAVLLMADTLVIGPSVQSHVQVADMTQPLVLYRGKAGIAARWAGNLQVGENTYQQRCSFDPGTTLTTEQISLALERV